MTLAVGIFLLFFAVSIVPTTIVIKGYLGIDDSQYSSLVLSITSMVMSFMTLYLAGVIIASSLQLKI